MANIERGDVVIVSGENTYRFRMSWNAMVCLKADTGLSLKGVMSELEKQGDDADPDLIVSLLHAAAQDNHPDITRQEVGGLWNDDGLEGTLEVIQMLVHAAFPKANGKQVAANPQAATKKKRN